MATHIQIVKTQNEAVKAAVQTLLGWNNSQYNAFQEQMGYDYLETELGWDTPFVAQIPYQKTFWSWWINHWVNRDIEFLRCYEGSVWAGTSAMYEFYKANHASKLMIESDLNILSNSYGVMIKRLIKEVHD